MSILLAYLASLPERALLTYIGPFLYGSIGGAVCCLVFFYAVFHRVETMTAKAVRKKALKLAEFAAVAKAAAVVPTTKVETLCKLVRFDDDIVSDVIQCRAVFFSNSITFYVVDELVTLPDHRQEVRKEHLLGRINSACIDTTAVRISKYHRHANANQRHAPVKGKCTILTAKTGLPLFIEDPTQRLRERLTAARRERARLLKQLRAQVRAAANGHSSGRYAGPINVETLGSLEAASAAHPYLHEPIVSGLPTTVEPRSKPTGGASQPAREASSLLSQQQQQQQEELSNASVQSSGSSFATEGSNRSWASLATSFFQTVQQSFGSASVDAASAAGAEPWLDGDSFHSFSPVAEHPHSLPQHPHSRRGRGRHGKDGLVARALAWWRGGTGKGHKRPRDRKKHALTRSDTAAQLEAVEKLEESLYSWRIAAIKFPTRRENERWLNLLQSTEQSSQWRSFIAHLPNHDVLNLLLARLFFESTRTSGLHDTLVKKIEKQLQKMSSSLQQSLRGNIYLDKLTVGGEVPLVSNVSDATLTPSGETEFDFDVLYRGGLAMTLRAAVTYRDIHVPDILFHIRVLELAGRMRFNVGPPPTEKFWLGAPRPPSLRLEMTQEVASHEGLLNAVMHLLPDMSKTISNVVSVKLFEDMILPGFDDYPWPVIHYKPKPDHPHSASESHDAQELSVKSLAAATGGRGSGASDAQSNASPSHRDGASVSRRASQSDAAPDGEGSHVIMVTSPLSPLSPFSPLSPAPRAPAAADTLRSQKNGVATPRDANQQPPPPLPPPRRPPRAHRDDADELTSTSTLMASTDRRAAVPPRASAAAPAVPDTRSRVVSPPTPPASRLGSRSNVTLLSAPSKTATDADSTVTAQSQPRRTADRLRRHSALDDDVRAVFEDAPVAFFKSASAATQRRGTGNFKSRGSISIPASPPSAASLGTSVLSPADSVQRKTTKGPPTTTTTTTKKKKK